MKSIGKFNRPVIIVFQKLLNVRSVLVRATSFFHLYSVNIACIAKQSPYICKKCEAFEAVCYRRSLFGCVTLVCVLVLKQTDFVLVLCIHRPRVEWMLNSCVPYEVKWPTYGGSRESGCNHRIPTVTFLRLNSAVCWKFYKHRRKLEITFIMTP